ncbi:uncharacterized protein LOC125725036 [Brienomyrus brachyistius]|uniref:uncharacterized protein LOC125725036 n=1 Tax=Brienomyrus brachyistius TaxID=42636 RepID=UPI0020B2754F|nr:uncharacterized protein LOC125725036 [Brienomyrus brachyistius]
MVTFWLLVALWTPSAEGYPLSATEAATNGISNAFRANLETRGNEETGRSEEHTAAGAELASVEEMVSFSTPSYTKSKEPHTLSSPMVASNTRTQRSTLLLSSNPSTAPKETGHSSTTEHKTSDRPQQHSDGPHLGHVTTLTATTQRPPQSSALPAASGKVTLRMTTTSMRATVAKIDATSYQKLSSFSQSTTSVLRDKTTSTNKTQVKSTPGLTTFSTHTTTTAIALTTTKLIETTVPSISTATTKISEAIIEKHGNGAGTTVAAVIIGAIVIMIGAIAFIMLRKKRRQERNKYNTTWAGPTPFLDGEIQANIPLGEDDDGGKRQPHKRISVPNFLSGLSSKRESLLKDEEEQVPMEGLVQGSTFSRPQDSVSPPSNGSVLSDEAQPLGATPTPDPESPSPDTSTKGEDNFGQDPIEDDAITETQPDPPAPLVEVDLEPPPGQEALPPPPSDGPIVPPPPPLPPSTE